MSAKKTVKEPSTYETNDIVLGKVKGYPPWPARIVAPDDAPGPVLKERPKSAKTPFYCVRFFPAGDYAWQAGKDMTKLQKHEIEAYISEPSKKQGELLLAYKIALDPTDWEAGKEKERKMAEEMAKAEPVDELEEDDDAGEDDASGGAKKRKRDGEDKKAKGVKKAKVAKADEALSSKSKKKVKKGPISSAMIVESEDEGEKKKDKGAKADDDEDDEEAGSPEAKMVKGWRHELQRIFLNKKESAKSSDMQKASDTLKHAEEYGDKMTVGVLSSTKIGKVVKKVAALGAAGIPDGDEHKIVERCAALMAVWSNVLSGTSTNGEAAAPVTNGNGNGKVEEAKADLEPASADVPMENGDAKTTEEAKTETAAAEPEKPAPEPSADAEMAEAAPAAAPATETAVSA